MAAAEFEQFVGIPFEEQGRSFMGCDCWGLLWLTFLELRYIALPSYADRHYHAVGDRAAIAALIAGELEPWKRINARDARAFDGVLMQERGIECHIGVIVKPGYVLHTGSDMGVSRIENYRHLSFQRRISRFLRYGAE